MTTKDEMITAIEQETGENFWMINAERMPAFINDNFCRQIDMLKARIEELEKFAKVLG